MIIKLADGRSVLSWTLPITFWNSILFWASAGAAWYVYKTNGYSHPFFWGFLAIAASTWLIWHYQSRQVNLVLKEEKAFAQDERIKESDRNWQQYNLYLQNQGALPSVRPMTRSELTDFSLENYPLIFDGWARMGAQINRNIIEQVANPFFPSGSIEEQRARVAHFLEARGIYLDKYPPLN